MKKTYFSSEMVSPGHPDKVMDSIAEAIVEAHLSHDNYARVAVDGVCKNNTVVLAGEISSRALINPLAITKKVIADIGYTFVKSPDFNDQTVIINPLFTTQSPDIAQGVNQGDKIGEGAGDQGIVFGGAIREAPDLTGHAHYLSRFISYEIYKKGFDWARPDQKTQVTIEYEDGKAVRVADVVVAISHTDSKPLSEIRTEVKEVVDKVLSEYQKKTKLSFENYNLHCNSTGKFAVYGPVADAGEVGRKIVCDQYGGYFAVGGGNLNGKDPSKVDRSGVYMARYVAKNLVANGYADKVQIEVGYVIGEPEPVSVHVETFGTAHKSEEEIDNYVSQFSFAPTKICEFLHLRDQRRDFNYLNLGMYGHIGKSFVGDRLPWEVVTLEKKEDSKVETPEKKEPETPEKKEPETPEKKEPEKKVSLKKQS